MKKLCHRLIDELAQGMSKLHATETLLKKGGGETPTRNGHDNHVYRAVNIHVCFSL